MLDPQKSNVTVKTFDDYADYVIIPYIVRHLEPVDRVDIYKDDSLKSFARQCREQGEPLRVLGNTKIPVNWKTFLRVNSNKFGLFSFIASKLQNVVTGNKLLVCTLNENVVTTTEVNTEG